MSDKLWPYITPGISDNCFIQGNVPLTREEVRVIILAKSRIKEDHVIHDIGAGTGSISIEAALMAKNGMVYAVENNPQALVLLDRNKELFQADNMKIICGRAPEALDGLPAADRVIIGGSGGRLVEIVEKCAARALKKGGILTVSAVTLDTLVAAQEVLFKPPWINCGIVQVAVTRIVRAGELKLFKGANPVFILTAERSTA